MSIADTIIYNIRKPLSKVLIFVRHLASYLTPEDDWIESFKQRFCTLLDPFFRPLGRPLITRVPDNDYIKTVDKPSDDVEEMLFPKYQRNFLSTKKYRTVDGERQWTVGAFVFDPDDTNWQHHVYLFPSSDGGTEVYGHTEDSASRDPYGHVTDPRKHGDPDDHLGGIL